MCEASICVVLFVSGYACSHFIQKFDVNEAGQAITQRFDVVKIQYAWHVVVASLTNRNTSTKRILENLQYCTYFLTRIQY